MLRLARSGKVGTKRKPDPDMDDEKAEDEVAEERKVELAEDRGYVAKKWKPVPESQLEAEHRHFEFLAKRRKGLPSLYGPEQANAALQVPMRKTKVQRTGAEGEVVVYEVLVPEGQSLTHEIDAAALTANPALLTLAPLTLASGTVIEGLGIANADGVLVTPLLQPSSALAAAPRRNRPPPKKKGGPGRGKKRVTFTNPDGSTYTTVVPNATKIVPKPGQTVKHVAKGEEPGKDISAEEAAKTVVEEKGDGEEGEGGEGDEGSDEEGSDDGDDDGREEGELSDDEAPKSTAAGTPVPGKAGSATGAATSAGDAGKGEDVTMDDAPPPTSSSTKARDASSSPELPLAKAASHSRQTSTVLPTTTEETMTSTIDTATLPEHADFPTATTAEPAEPGEVEMETEPARFEDGDEDLLGSLEKSLGDGYGDDGTAGAVGGTNHDNGASNGAGAGDDNGATQGDGSDDGNGGGGEGEGDGSGSGAAGDGTGPSEPADES